MMKTEKLPHRHLKLMEKEVHNIERLLRKQYPPEHFTFRHVVSAFFGALLLGLSFIFNGLLYQVGLQVTPAHMVAIVVATITILTAEIYFIGYARVDNKRERPFGQFWFKRITAFYGVALFVAFGLIFLYGLDRNAGSIYKVFQLAIAASMPCAIGTALTDLLRE